MNNAKNLKVKNFKAVENHNPTFEGVGDEGVGFVFLQEYNTIPLSTLSIYSIRWGVPSDFEMILLHGKEITTGGSFNSGTITLTMTVNNSLGCLLKVGNFINN